jgi:valyl-tRNA synthetase
VVEKKLKRERGITRQELGREGFLAEARCRVALVVISAAAHSRAP